MVRKVQESESACDLKTKRSYTSYTDENRVAIGKYAVENSNAAALRHFRPHFMELGESTVKSFKTKYLAAVKENRGLDHPTDVTAIPSKKRGKPLPLGEMDSKVQKYIKALRKAGTPVSLPLVIASAKGIISSKDRSLLAKNGGHIALTTAWSTSLMNRMGMIHRKATTSKPKYSSAEFKSRKRSYLHAIVGMISTHAIPAELVVNWDQTGINLVPQELCLRVVTNIIPYVKKVRKEKGIPNQLALVIFDACSGHQSEVLNKVLEENQIRIVKVPSGCTDELQPLDLSMNKSCKCYLRSKFITWYVSEVEQVIRVKNSWGLPPHTLELLAKH